MFNADLALSVTMTAISTLISVVMLPANLLIYATSTYDGDVVKSLDWTSLFISLVVVIGAIGLGLLASAKVHSHRFNLFANKVSFKERLSRKLVLLIQTKYFSKSQQTLSLLFLYTKSLEILPDLR
jgi:predicted Na+-dependent transporter